MVVVFAPESVSSEIAGLSKLADFQNRALDIFLFKPGPAGYAT